MTAAYRLNSIVSRKEKRRGVVVVIFSITGRE